MSGWRSVAEVARWEFRRYLKPKQQVVGALVTLAMMLGGGLLGRLADDESSAVELAVVGGERLDLPDELGEFRIERHSTAELERLRHEVEERERDAVLLILGDAGGELVVRQAPAWRDDLARELSALAVRRRLESSGLEVEQLAAIQAPFQLAVDETAPRAGRGERIAAFVALGLTLLGLFTGMSYIFISVTGEKQNRLSEQVLSAVAPQAWIDGKILGLSGVSIVSVLSLVLSGLAFLALSRLFWTWSIPLPTTVQRPDLLLAALGFIFLGFIFWFAFFSAVAAMISDPHTSSRNQLMFLPMLMFVPAFMAASQPDAAWIRVLSIVPPTSAGVMPARLLVAELPWWEPMLAAALLFAAIGVIRRMAGTVFRLGMLMYGKEPSWAEVRRWLRDTA